MNSVLGKKGKFDEVDEFIFLNDLNQHLIEFDRKLLRNSLTEQYPNVFLFGLPRSGTTMLSQVLYNNLNISTFNNLAARFWDAPLVGLHFSNTVLKKDKKDNYTSNFGSTMDMNSPHEFSYFWRKHLLVDELLESLDVAKVGNSINWQRLFKYLINFNHINRSPFVYKTMEYTGLYIDYFLKYFSKSYFIYIQRDYLSVAKSIYSAWVLNTTGKNDWWGSAPLEYRKLMGLPLVDKVVGQMYYLDKMYKIALNKIPDNRLIKVQYTDLCQHPNDLLMKINDLIKIPVLSSPSSFEISNSSVDKNIEQRIVELLKTYKLS